MDSTLQMSYTEVAKQLFDRAEEFDVLLTNLQTLNSELKDRCGQVLTKIKALSGSNSLAARISCSVCATRPRTHIFMPCGHGGFCESCCERGRRRGRCFTCRGTVEAIMKVFL